MSGVHKHIPFWVRYWSYVEKTGDCWIWVGQRQKSGYGIIKRNYEPLAAHRVIWEEVHGLIPDGMFVCHNCDRPHCVNPSHMFLGTPKDNNLDCVRKGRNVRGRKQWKSVFTEDEVVAIANDYRSGMKVSLLAKKYGHARVRIYPLVHGKNWKWLTGLDKGARSRRPCGQQTAHTTQVLRGADRGCSDT